MNRTLFVAVTVSSLLLLPPAARAAGPGLTDCEMTFSLKGWSAVYRTAEGRGEVVCENGQKMPVKLTVHGGGLTFSKMDVLEGKGEFSEVRSIEEVLGSYGGTEVKAGAVKAGQAAVFTKGEVSLALAGKGRGVGLGLDFSKLEISRHE